MPLCHSARPKYGLLHHQVGPGFTKDMHDYLTVGKVLILEVTHGYLWVARLFSGENDWSDAEPRLHSMLHR